MKKEIQEIIDLSGGMKTDIDDRLIGDNQSSFLFNVDIEVPGEIKSREGKYPILYPTHSSVVGRVLGIHPFQKYILQVVWHLRATTSKSNFYVYVYYVEKDKLYNEVSFARRIPGFTPYTNFSFVDVKKRVFMFSTITTPLEFMQDSKKKVLVGDPPVEKEVDGEIKRCCRVGMWRPPKKWEGGEITLTEVIEEEGNLNGEYLYNITWYDKIRKYESSTNPGTIGPITVVNKKVKISPLPPWQNTTFSEYSVNIARRFYRIGGTSAIWQLVGEQDVCKNIVRDAEGNIISWEEPGEFIDNIKDENLGLELDAEGNDPPPLIYLGCMFRDRLFGVIYDDINKKGTNKVIYSNLSFPEAFPYDYDLGEVEDKDKKFKTMYKHIWIVGEEDVEAANEEITGLIPFQDKLICFMKNRMYHLIFDDIDYPTFVEVSRHIGCYAPRSIAVLHNQLIFFVHWSGIYSYDGNTVNLISKPMDKYFLKKEKYSIEKANGTIYKNKYYVSFPFENESIGVP